MEDVAPLGPSLIYITCEKVRPSLICCICGKVGIVPWKRRQKEKSQKAEFGCNFKSGGKSRSQLRGNNWTKWQGGQTAWDIWRKSTTGSGNEQDQEVQPEQTEARARGSSYVDRNKEWLCSFVKQQTCCWNGEKRDLEQRRKAQPGERWWHQWKREEHWDSWVILKVER